MTAIARYLKKNRDEALRLFRYLATGGWNTLFGILVYAALYRGLGSKVHYLVLLIPANILAITNAYICYKLLVFRTRGNIIKEYLRFYVVYGGTMLLGFALMFCFVDGLNLDPIVAQCVSASITIIVSYFSHRDFSFGKRPAVFTDEAEPSAKLSGSEMP